MQVGPNARLQCLSGHTDESGRRARGGRGRRRRRRPRERARGRAKEKATLALVSRRSHARASTERARAARERRRAPLRCGAVVLCKALSPLPLPSLRLRLRLQQFVIDGGGTDADGRVALHRSRRSECPINYAEKSDDGERKVHLPWCRRGGRKVLISLLLLIIQALSVDH